MMRFVYISILLFICIISINGQTTPSLESAREKYANGNYDEAITVLEQLLEIDENNLEAKKLLNEITKIKNQQQSLLLTENALIEIDANNFDNALILLEQAIALDPANENALELYLSINEIYQIEEESKEQAEASGTEKEEKEQVVTEEKTETIEISQLPDQEKEETAGREAIEDITATAANPFYLLVQLSPSFGLASSNNLDYIDSNVSLLGTKFCCTYYLPFWERRFGVSVDYAGYLLKIAGDEQINFRIHRANASARIRTYLFMQKQRFLTVGAKLNYHLYYLENLENQGVYNFVLIYSPSFGIFVSDPVFYRFLDIEFFKDFGLEAQADFMLMPGMDDDPLIIGVEAYGGPYYNIGDFGFALGYHLYCILQQNLSEIYHDIEISVRYFLK